MGRSQRHLREIRGLDSNGQDQGDLGDVYAPPITALNPDTASIANAGATNRTIATMTVTGGTAPITWSVANAAGMNCSFTANLLKSTANPIHATTGVKNAQITATDKWGKTKTEQLAVTLT